MNYQRIYDDIIARAVTRHRPEDYAERHHILPRCMGGSDDADNLVYLTGREHYLCHWLLYKIHKDSKSAYAWNLMSINSYSNSSRYTSKTFEYAKVAAARHKSKDMTGDKNPMYGVPSKYKGIPRSEDTKARISKARKKSILSEESMRRTKEASSKAVIATDTNGVDTLFSSASEAIEKGFATNPGSISNICTKYISKSGKRRLTHNGYSWRFAE